MQIHHIGIACADIEKAFVALTLTHKGTKRTQTVYDELQQASLCLVTTAEGVTFELVSGKCTAGLVKKGITYYHVCYSVPDLERSINELARVGAMLFVPPKPAVLFGGRRVAFLITTVGMTELLQE